MAEPLIITSSPRSDHQLDMTIELGPERTQQALQRAVRLVSKKARIPGFRPGRAPFGHVLRTFGREAVLSEILEDLGAEVIDEALKAEKIEPYGQPSLEDVKFDPIQFKLVVPLRPKAELGDYADIRIQMPEVVVSEADVDAELEKARQARMVLQEVNRPAAIGDTVLVDIKGTVGDTVIIDNQDWELILRGESGWLPGFDEAFVGLVAGDHKEFTLRYPEDSVSRYKGQEASFSVTVKAVKSKVLPELNDEFVRSLGDYADLADYRARRLEEIRRERQARSEHELEEAAIQALIARSHLAYPQAAVDDVVVELLSESEGLLREFGYDLEDYLRLQGKSLESYRAELRPAAEKRLQTRLVLNEFAKREGIVVSAEEEQAHRDAMLGRVEDLDERAAMGEILDSELGRRFIRQDIVTERALARLRAVVTGQAAAAEAGHAVAEEAAGAAPAPAAESAGEEPALAAEPAGSELAPAGESAVEGAAPAGEGAK